MYRAFNLKLPSNVFSMNLVAHGQRQVAALSPALDQGLRAGIRSDGSLDASHLRGNWFPEVRCEVFVSHGRRDADTAFGLAGWLSDAFGITSFVDSAVWGNAEDLLQEIDDRHCRNRRDGTYSYEKRNRSTAHVHALLSTALANMIDRAECLMFLNTAGSAPVVDSMEKTDSPWIFTEIETANLIRRRSLEEHRGIKVAKRRLDEGDLRMLHDLQLAGFTDVDEHKLREWQGDAQSSAMRPLDIFYDLCP